MNLPEYQWLMDIKPNPNLILEKSVKKITINLGMKIEIPQQMAVLERVY